MMTITENGDVWDGSQKIAEYSDGLWLVDDGTGTFVEPLYDFEYDLLETVWAEVLGQ